MRTEVRCFFKEPRVSNACLKSNSGGLSLFYTVLKSLGFSLTTHTKRIALRVYMKFTLLSRAQGVPGGK